jgi:hypothetical protein
MKKGDPYHIQGGYLNEENVDLYNTDGCKLRNLRRLRTKYF